jgi:hypothetical protein
MNIKQVEGADVEKIEHFFHALMKLCETSDLERGYMIAIMTKLVVMMSLDEGDKEEFMKRMAYVYDFESFMKPDQMEIH